MNTTTTTPAERTALLATLEVTEPGALSSCPGWTADHIAAHICGTYEEIRRHVEADAAGRPLEQTAVGTSARRHYESLTTRNSSRGLKPRRFG